MGSDVLSSKLKFTTSDGKEYEGEIPQQRWSPAPTKFLEAMGVNPDVHTLVGCGDYHVVVNGMASLEEIKEHDCFWVSDDLLNVCVNMRRVSFRTIVADIHAFRYFADCMNREKMRVVASILPAIECEEHVAMLLPEADVVPVVEVVGEQEASERLLPFLPLGIMNNIYSFLDPDTHDWCSWLEVHDKHAGVFCDPDAKCSVKYQNFLAVEIVFSEYFFEECEDISGYMYTNKMIDSKVMIRIAGYVVHD